MSSWHSRLGIVVAIACSTIVLATAAGAQCPIYSTQFGTPGADFCCPSAVAIGPSGNVYVVDSINDNVHEFSGSGTLVTTWGSSGAADGRFLHPVGVAVDASGYVYVSDSYNSRIQKFTSSGTYVTQWGGESVPGGQFYPGWIAVDAAGHVYVMESPLSLVAVFTSDGVFLGQWGSLGAGDGQFGRGYIGGMAVDAAGYVYVSDYYNNRIQKFTSSGEYVTQWEAAGNCGGLPWQPRWQPLAVTVDPAGNVYVSDECKRVVAFTGSGTYLCQWGSEGTGPGQFGIASGVAADQVGNVFVVDAQNSRVQKFVPAPVPAKSATWGRLRATYR